MSSYNALYDEVTCYLVVHSQMKGIETVPTNAILADDDVTLALLGSQKFDMKENSVSFLTSTCYHCNCVPLFQKLKILRFYGSCHTNVFVLLFTRF